MGTRPNSSAPRAPLARLLRATKRDAREVLLPSWLCHWHLLSTIFFRLQLPQTNIHLPTARASSRTRPQSRAGHPSQLRTSVWQHHGTRRAMCARISPAPAVLRHGRIERSRWQRSFQARCIARPCSESSMPACAWSDVVLTGSTHHVRGRSNHDKLRHVCVKACLATYRRWHKWTFPSGAPETTGTRSRKQWYGAAQGTSVGSLALKDVQLK